MGSLSYAFSASLSQSFTTGAHYASQSDDDAASGYEMRLKDACINHSAVPLSELRGAFPAGNCAHYIPDGHLRFLIGHDASTSQWENMDTYRIIQVIIVVVNAHDDSIDVRSTIQLVQTVFQAQFSDKICRCFLLDSSEEVKTLCASSKNFVTLRTVDDVEQTAKECMLDIGAATIVSMNSTLAKLSNQKVIDKLSLRTPLDKSDLVDVKSPQLISRVLKKKGDILLMLGAYDAALLAYGETQFGSNADPLWCSAVLESIAGVRFQQLQSTFAKVKVLEDIVLELQSESTEWNETLIGKIDEIDGLAHSVVEGIKQLLSVCKQQSIPNSMRSRLTKEINDVLSAKAAQIEALTQRSRACIAAGALELPSDPNAFRIPVELKTCIEEILHKCFGEVEVYLRESLRQQHRTVEKIPNKSILNDRDLETRLKALTYLVDRGQPLIFTAEVNRNRSYFQKSYSGAMQRVLPYFMALCLLCGYRRRAICLAVEFSNLDRSIKNYPRAIHSLVMAAVMCGVDLDFSELRHDVSCDPFYQLLFKEKAAARIRALSVSCGSCLPEVSFFLSGEEPHPDQGTSKQRESALSSETKFMHVPLLLELLEVLEEADCGGGIRCRLATFLLFRYPHHLDCAIQEMLINVARVDAVKLDPHVNPSTAVVPFCTAWEALPLPPHLAPKTVPVGGALFTFIDTQRLKLTVLSLNGKKLNSRVVWTVGDVGSVLMTLFNPFDFTLKLSTLSLQCRGCAELDDHNRIREGTLTHVTGPLAPTCYVLTDVSIPPHKKARVQLQVQPNMEGFLRVEGMEIRTAHFRSLLPIEGKLPEPMGIPVLQRLPLVSCTVSVSELEIFGGQRVDFSVRVVNCGQVPIAHISLTAHSETCQMEGCEGCKERTSRKDATVSLNKAALQASSRAPLQPGDVVTIPVHLQAPSLIEECETHFVIFRIDCSLPHDPPTMPPNVPSAVPVFGLIPRRVTETRMRTFHAPSLAVSSIQLTKDKRYVDVRIVNRSQRHSVALHLSLLPFADLPDALLVPGAEYVVPPIAITQVPDDTGYLYSVPWEIRELGKCVGELLLDFGVIGKEVVCSEPLEECVVTVDMEITQTGSEGHLSLRHWNSHAKRLLRNVSMSRSAPSRTAVPETSRLRELEDSSVQGSTRDYVEDPSFTNDMTDDAPLMSASSARPSIVIPAVKPVQIHVHATARWRRAVPLRFQVSMNYHLDVGILSGPVDATVMVGGHGKYTYSQNFEILAFKVGEHDLSITVTDNCEREITHHMPFIVRHGTDE